jgi:hypothetical protein
MELWLRAQSKKWNIRKLGPQILINNDWRTYSEFDQRHPQVQNEVTEGGSQDQLQEEAKNSRYNQAGSVGDPRKHGHKGGVAESERQGASLLRNEEPFQDGVEEF